jgi:hypothetical protein
MSWSVISARSEGSFFARSGIKHSLLDRSARIRNTSLYCRGDMSAVLCFLRVASFSIRQSLSSRLQPQRYAEPSGSRKASGDLARWRRAEVEVSCLACGEGQRRVPFSIIIFIFMGASYYGMVGVQGCVWCRLFFGSLLTVAEVSVARHWHEHEIQNHLVR